MVGILTFVDSPSYGASLQMCGLYHTLVSLGVDAEVIHYKNTFMAEKRHIKSSSKSGIRKIAAELLDSFRKAKFREFEQQLTVFPQRCLCEKDDLEEVAERYDFVICGSDQVWNPDITGEDLNFFLCFCDDAKRISYAASFGMEELPLTFSVKAKEELKRFSAISVREEQGARIVSELLGSDCRIVLDPSMLVSRERWETMEKKLPGLPEKYIAKFIFNYDENVEKRITELSEKTNLPVVTVGGSILSKLKKGIYTGPIGPKEWLYVLNHAEHIVTDSFHGAAFSVIFQKDVYVSLASSTNSRLKTLVHTFSLEERVIGEGLSREEIDYRYIQRVMEEKRQTSLDFLKCALGIGD